MPQLIVLLAAIVGCWYFYRRFTQDAQRLSRKTHRRARERRTGAMGTLVKDPKTGEYRVKREDE